MLTAHIHLDPAGLLAVASEQGAWRVATSNDDPNASHYVEQQCELEDEGDHKTDVVASVLFKNLAGLFYQVIELVHKALGLQVPEKLQLVDCGEPAVSLIGHKPGQESYNVRDEVARDVAVGDLSIGDGFTRV